MTTAQQIQTTENGNIGGNGEKVKKRAAAGKTVKSAAKAKKFKVDDGSLVTLFKALSIRAKFGGEAERTYKQVVGLLLTE